MTSFRNHYWSLRRIVIFRFCWIRSPPPMTAYKSVSQSAKLLACSLVVLVAPSKIIQTTLRYNVCVLDVSHLTFFWVRFVVVVEFNFTAIAFICVIQTLNLVYSSTQTRQLANKHSIHPSVLPSTSSLCHFMYGYFDTLFPSYRSGLLLVLNPLPMRSANIRASMWSV